MSTAKPATSALAMVSSGAAAASSLAARRPSGVGLRLRSAALAAMSAQAATVTTARARTAVVLRRSMLCFSFSRDERSERFVHVAGSAGHPRACLPMPSRSPGKTCDDGHVDTRRVAALEARNCASPTRCPATGVAPKLRTGRADSVRRESKHGSPSFRFLIPSGPPPKRRAPILLEGRRSQNSYFAESLPAWQAGPFGRCLSGVVRRRKKGPGGESLADRL